MVIDFLNYILAMLLAGAGSFGGGPGGLNIIKEYAANWVTNAKIMDVVTLADAETAAMMQAKMMDELFHISTISQYGGYSQGITLAAYLGAKTQLGILGSILGVAAFILPSVLIVAVLLKIGEKLYKNVIFKYSLKYINLFAAGLICMLLWNYIATVFSTDPIIYVAVAGLACFFNIYFNIHPALIILCGAVIGAIWRA